MKLKEVATKSSGKPWTMRRDAWVTAGMAGQPLFDDGVGMDLPRDGEKITASERVASGDGGSVSWAVRLDGPRGASRILFVTRRGADGLPMVAAWRGAHMVVRGAIVFAGDDPTKPRSVSVGSAIGRPGYDGFAAFTRAQTGYSLPLSNKALATASSGKAAALVARHRKAVVDALVSGERVDPGVMADYPELARHTPGTPAFLVAVAGLNAKLLKAGTVMCRVVWGKVGSTVEPVTPSMTGLPEPVPGVRALAVSRDTAHWRKYLANLHGRDEDDFTEIDILTAHGDVLAPDPRAGENAPPGGVLLTARKVLRKGSDFHVRGKLAK